jgi:hypothetical protein
VTCGNGVNIAPGAKAYLVNIDQCPYPDRSKFPPELDIPTNPDNGQIIDTAGIEWWAYLRMDEWLEDALTNACPQISNVWTDGLGRYMLGRIDEQESDIVRSLLTVVTDNSHVVTTSDVIGSVQLIMDILVEAIQSCKEGNQTSP